MLGKESPDIRAVLWGSLNGESTLLCFVIKQDNVCYRSEEILTEGAKVKGFFGTFCRIFLHHCLQPEGNGGGLDVSG